MKIKQIFEDFKVDEVYDLEELGKKNNESAAGKLNYYYFRLWKRDYTTQRAVEQVCRSFHIQLRDAHFAGTKDRAAVTTQLISLKRLHSNWEKDVEYFNEKNKDIQLEYIAMFPSRLNLGDNLGNKFEIVVRDVDEKDIDNMKVEMVKVKERGVPNFFDSQRFGFCGNNHIVGKYLLTGDFEKAFFTIITAYPLNNQKEEHMKLVSYLTDNWEAIMESNDWSEVLSICPDWLRQERQLIDYVAKFKNDFLGAISLLPKKIRSLYVNSYQSYLFNETLKYLDSIGKLEGYKELPLIAAESELKDDWGEFVQDILDKDGLTLQSFEMKSAPTLRPSEIFRETFVSVKDLEVLEIGADELASFASISTNADAPQENLEREGNEGRKKVTLSFELGRGSYATNVIKVLFDGN
ncbi:MAG: tRNA pseudouridine(13) synthase TruD [Nanoarchaeota archaeon]|jgi:tRNA pseudouridine13 synthase|nr:tRNA pseudouridine(13) synthase TruD [Nanoarchaeota archaeon]